MDQTQASWLADGVREIERVVNKATIVEPKIVKLDYEKPGTYAFITPQPAEKEPKIDIRTAKPLWHNERLETPEQLVLFINSMQNDREIPPNQSAVYVGRDSIRYVFDFEDRRNRATCPLIVSQPWKWLMSPQAPMDHRTTIRVLRITFAGCLHGASSGLVDVLRKVKWKSGGELESNLQRGKEALGRQILNEAAGIADFPDEFTLTLPVFENVAFTTNVRVALELHPVEQKFELIPFPNELQRGLTETLLRLQEQIKDTKVPTFIGAVSNGSE